MKKFTIKTLGCKVNQYDTQAVREQLLRAGWREEEKGAQLCVINTCTVTAKSDDKAKYYIRQARRKNPEAKIVLTGCFAPSLRTLPAVDMVVPNWEKEKFLKRAGILSKDDPFDYLGAAFGITQFEGRTRAFVKIQDGCDAFCSFCAVPFARGRSRSRPLGEIVAEARALAEAGYPEIVLTGVNLTSFGLKKEDMHSLFQVIQTVDQVSGYRRLRVSSLEPMGLTADLIQHLASLEKFCPHFHLPLQSGSNLILKKMRRRYSILNFLKNVELIYKLFPGCSISTDVIVGFPGETPQDFEATQKACREAGFSKTHIFPYSRRAGTLASRYEDLSPEVILERTRDLTVLCDKLALKHKQKFLGETHEVLLEGAPSAKSQGFTRNYLRVCIPQDGASPASFVFVTLDQCTSYSFTGRICHALPESKM